jgi:hypothetical protein
MELNMKPSNMLLGINRRAMLTTLAALPVLSETLLPASAQAQVTQGGLVPSWNN